MVTQGGIKLIGALTPWFILPVSVSMTQGCTGCYLWEVLKTLVILDVFEILIWMVLLNVKGIITFFTLELGVSSYTVDCIIHVSIIENNLLRIQS